MSPDGCFVLAALDLSVDNGIDLYTMDLFGTGLLRVNPEPNDLNGSDNTFDKALITTDSQRIVFNGKYDAQGNRALFSVRPDGQDLIRISGSSLMTAYSSFSLSPNSQQVIYRAAQKDSTTYELLLQMLTAVQSTPSATPSQTAAAWPALVFTLLILRTSFTQMTILSKARLNSTFQTPKELERH